MTRLGFGEPQGFRLVQVTPTAQRAEPLPLPTPSLRVSHDEISEEYPLPDSHTSPLTVSDKESL